MNKEFVKKMVKTKRLEYEAIKEIMPEDIRNRIDAFQKHAFNFIKEVAIEILKDDMNEKSNKENKCDIDNKDNTDSKGVKKINVNFN